MNAPINFFFNGKSYQGYFSKVQGSGHNDVYHLECDGYYCGRLRYSHPWGWAFDSTPKTAGMEILVDYFEFYLISWFAA